MTTRLIRNALISYETRTDPTLRMLPLVKSNWTIRRAGETGKSRGSDAQTSACERCRSHSQDVCPLTSAFPWPCERNSSEVYIRLLIHVYIVCLCSHIQRKRPRRPRQAKWESLYVMRVARQKGGEKQIMDFINYCRYRMMMMGLEGEKSDKPLH